MRVWIFYTKCSKNILYKENWKQNIWFMGIFIIVFGDTYLSVKWRIQSGSILLLLNCISRISRMFMVNRISFNITVLPSQLTNLSVHINWQAVGRFIGWCCDCVVLWLCGAVTVSCLAQYYLFVTTTTTLNTHVMEFI